MLIIRSLILLWLHLHSHRLHLSLVIFLFGFVKVSNRICLQDTFIRKSLNFSETKSASNNNNNNNNNNKTMIMIHFLHVSSDFALLVFIHSFCLSNLAVCILSFSFKICSLCDTVSLLQMIHQDRKTIIQFEAKARNKTGRDGEGAKERKNEERKEQQKKKERKREIWRKDREERKHEGKGRQRQMNTRRMQEERKRRSVNSLQRNKTRNIWKRTSPKGNRKIPGRSCWSCGGLCVFTCRLSWLREEETQRSEVHDRFAKSQREILRKRKREMRKGQIHRWEREKKREAERRAWTTCAEFVLVRAKE